VCELQRIFRHDKLTVNLVLCCIIHQGLEFTAFMPCAEVRVRSRKSFDPAAGDDSNVSIALDNLPQHINAMIFHWRQLSTNLSGAMTS